MDLLLVSEYVIAFAKFMELYVGMESKDMITVTAGYVAVLAVHVASA